MKKLFFAIILVCFVPALAFSQASPWPPPGYEVEAFEFVPGTGFVSMGTGDVMAKARCFGSFPADSACNKDWEIRVKIHASIAQWIEWSMTATRWDWFVRKPGTYAADCISGTIASNQNILVDYHDFGDLIAEDEKAVDDTIEVWYAVWPLGTPPAIDDNAWVRSYMLNDPAEWDTIYDCEALHNGITWKLWNRINVERCNSACEYQDHAYISLILLCQKEWIDRTTGYFVVY
jgi:hypothetical protein